MAISHQANTKALHYEMKEHFYCNAT